MSPSDAVRRLVLSFLFVLTAALGFGAAQSARAATFVLLESQPGDFVGAGARTLLGEADGELIAAPNDAGGVSLFFDGAGAKPEVFFHFGPSAQQLLTPGVYEGATRFRAQTANTPGLDVGMAARGCQELSGRFVILELAVDTAGEVTRFAADFEQRCKNAVPALFGAIRFRSDVPIFDGSPLQGGVAAGQLAVARAENAALASEVAQLRSEKAALASDAASLRSRIAVLGPDNAKLRSDNAALGSEIAGLRSQISRLGPDNAALRGQNAALRGENAGLRGDNAFLRGQNASLQADVGNLGHELYECREHNGELPGH